MPRPSIIKNFLDNSDNFAKSISDCATAVGNAADSKSPATSIPNALLLTAPAIVSSAIKIAVGLGIDILGTGLYLIGKGIELATPKHADKPTSTPPTDTGITQERKTSQSVEPQPSTSPLKPCNTPNTKTREQQRGG